MYYPARLRVMLRHSYSSCSTIGSSFMDSIPTRSGAGACT